MAQTFSNILKPSCIMFRYYVSIIHYHTSNETHTHIAADCSLLLASPVGFSSSFFFFALIVCDNGNSENITVRQL